jgi:hypothetical protein
MTQIWLPVSDVSTDEAGALTLAITPFSGSSTYAEATASLPSDEFNFTNRHIEVEYGFGTGTIEVIMQMDTLSDPAAGTCTLYGWHCNPIDGDLQILNGNDSSIVVTMGLLPVADTYGTEWNIQSEPFNPAGLVHDWQDLVMRFYQGNDGDPFIGSGGLTYAYLETPDAGSGLTYHGRGTP